MNLVPLLSHPQRIPAQLAVLYEHPAGFEPLFDALQRRGIGYEAIQLSGHGFDPANREIPAPLILSRVALSSFLREPDPRPKKWIASAKR